MKNVRDYLISLFIDSDKAIAHWANSFIPCELCPLATADELGVKCSVGHRRIDSCTDIFLEHLDDEVDV